MSIFTTFKIYHRALVEEKLMIYITQNDFLFQVTLFSNPLTITVHVHAVLSDQLNLVSLSYLGLVYMW